MNVERVGIKHDALGTVAVMSIQGDDVDVVIPEGWSVIPLDVAELAMRQAQAENEIIRDAARARMREYAQEVAEQRADVALREAHRLGMDLHAAAILFGVPELEAIADGRQRGNGS